MEPTARETSAESLQEIAAGVEKLTNALMMSVRPLFFEDEYKRRVRPLASCVLVTVNDAKFILTAGHVIRKDGFRNEFNRAPVALATPAGRLVSFEKWDGFCTGHPSEGQDLDIGFVRLDDEACSALKDCHFLAEDERELNHKDDRSGNSLYLLIGYPGSRKLTKIWRGQIKQFSFCIYTYPVSEGWYEKLNLSAKNHILLKWNERNVTHDGVHRNLPNVKGISGGGVFRVHKKTGEARLVGIVTEHHKHFGLIVATRIDHFILLAAICGIPEVRALLGTKPEKLKQA